MEFFYIVRPKQNLVLDVNLRWKKAAECGGTGPGEALGLEAADSMNVAAWVSFDGVSALSYPEDTACSQFEKSLGEEFSFSKNKRVFSHLEFIDAVDKGEFPDFLLRRPINKAEKKLLLGSYGKKHRKKKNFRSDGFSPYTTTDLRGDNTESEGVENMFYIVNTRKNLFLTKTLSWIDIGSIKSNRKLMSQLFCIRDDITAAQTVALWVAPPGDTISPCTPATLKRKYRVAFPNPTSDSLSDGIHSRKYPAFLAQKPKSNKEIIAFQLALRSGLRNIEERTLLSLGQTGEIDPGHESSPLPFFESGGALDPDADLLALGEDEATSTSDQIPAMDKDHEDGVPFSFHHHPSTVAESSDLIRTIIETSVAFGKVVTEAQSLVAQKRLDLEIIQKQLLDLDHVAEFYSLNAADGYRMNKTRKEFLQRRRVIKDEIIVLEMVTNYLSNGVTPNNINAFVNGIMSLDRRSYTTRAMTVSDVKDLIRNPKTQALILGKTADLESESKDVPIDEDISVAS